MVKGCQKFLLRRRAKSADVAAVERSVIPITASVYLGANRCVTLVYDRPLPYACSIYFGGRQFNHTDWTDVDDTIEKVEMAEVSVTVVTFLVLIVAFVANLALHRIEEGHVGVYYRGGALLNSLAQPGFHLMIPLLTTYRSVQVKSASK